MAEFQAVKDEQSGGVFIPASRRPDGTWRKPIRVKEGYVPQEEVPVYESKGKQWAKKPAYPVGMNPALIAAASTEKKVKKPKDDANKPAIPGLAPAAAKKKKNKPTKADSGVKEVSSKLAGFTIEEPTFGAAEKPHVTNNSTPKVSQPSSNAEAPSSTDPAKRLKNVKKKLRDIEALEAKIKSGEVKNPDKDQLEKIKRKSEVVKEIKELEKMVK